MKSTKKIIASALAIVALVMASCPQESKSEEPAPKTDPALNGTWLEDDGSGSTVKFNNGTFENSYIGIGAPVMKGTFTTSNGTLTMTMTHVWGKVLNDSLEAKWYSKADLKAPAVLAVLSTNEHTVTAEDIDGLFASQSATGTYVISGNTLTITWDNGSDPFTLTKQ